MSCLQRLKFLPLLAWGFAFLYNICQLLIPNGFQNPNHIHHLQTWLDLLFLSFSLQSHGLSDLMPLSPPARVLADTDVLWCDVSALIVTRLIALQYIKHTPKKNSDK